MNDKNMLNHNSNFIVNLIQKDEIKLKEEFEVQKIDLTNLDPQSNLLREKLNSSVFNLILGVYMTIMHSSQLKT
jgi:hypothetical protein